MKMPRGARRTWRPGEGSCWCCRRPGGPGGRGAAISSAAPSPGAARRTRRRRRLPPPPPCRARRTEASPQPNDEGRSQGKQRARGGGGSGRERESGAEARDERTAPQTAKGGGSASSEGTPAGLPSPVWLANRPRGLANPTGLCAERASGTAFHTHPCGGRWRRRASFESRHCWGGACSRQSVVRAEATPSESGADNAQIPANSQPLPRVFLGEVSRTVLQLTQQCFLSCFKADFFH